MEEEDLLALFMSPVSLRYRPCEEPQIEELDTFQLTRYEYSKVICKRIDQLMNGAKTELDPELVRNLSLADIARQELKMGVMPLIVRRIFPNLSKIQVLRLYGKKISSYDVK
jgi:DNA-directed RNA polymerase subunit K/omega